MKNLFVSTLTALALSVSPIAKADYGQAIAGGFKAFLIIGITVGAVGAGAAVGISWSSSKDNDGNEAQIGLVVVSPELMSRLKAELNENGKELIDLQLAIAHGGLITQTAKEFGNGPAVREFLNAYAIQTNSNK